MSHTNTAALSFAAVKILKTIGRLGEHELWDGKADHRRYIERDIQEAAEEINMWVAENIRREARLEAAE